MKAISLHPPWAHLMVRQWDTGRFMKRFETRGWRTQYRGPIAICSTKSFPKGIAKLCCTEPFKSAFGLNHPEVNTPGCYIVDLTPAMPLGVVLGIGRLTEIVPAEEALTHKVMLESPCEAGLGYVERHFGDYSPGRWAWLIEDMRPLPELIQVKGKQGLWNWPEGDAVLERLVA